ncbi:hypothetical protein PSN45_004776 [Yamadazyma tenuis]|uniref:uncharacterized protein n=1 Tax=Candida tenuis TaxID=2315449 RepID=UPI00279D4962|nr:hypothetical protein PSN45_004776 [Yamadazyma tenuis]
MSEDTQSKASQINSEANALKHSDQKTLGTASNVFNNALEFWTKTDLPAIQNQLDQQGIEIKEEQKDSLLNRKNLASKTKEFRKLSDPEKLDQFKSLLKLYQNEIDTLTNKSKKIEGYFFDFYRSIAEAPDPKPLLEISLDSVIESGDVANLKAEINKLNEELSKKADYNQLKKRLLATEQQSAEMLSTKLKAKEDEFKALIDEKESNWQEKEKLLQKQLDDYKNTIEELKTSNEVTELQLNSQNEDLNSNNDNLTILAELQIVSRDAEYSKQRLLEVEKRNEDLRRELSISKNNLQVETLKEGFNRKISELESENVLLIAELEQSRKSIKNTTSNNNKHLEYLNKEIKQLKSEISDLKVKANKTKDYDEIKSELHFLRQIEFEDDEADSEEDGEDDADSSSLSLNYKTKNKVDSLLIKRNKALNNELVTYRSEHDALVSKLQSLEKELADCTAQITNITQKNQRLEDELSKFDKVSNFNDNMSMISGWKPAGSIIAPSLNSLSTSNNNNDESSILPLITKQRDRFRDRTNELDNEVKKQHTVINDLKRTINKLKKDNEELYERTRYLAATSNNSKSRSTLQPKRNSDLESNNPYKSSYESKLHPIEQFRIQEQERISSRLSPFERIFISLTRAILATRTTRMLFLLYCVGLHLIVMLITIHTTGINTRMIPEVGINTSTGGEASPNI